MLKLAAFFMLCVGTICGSSLSAMAESPSSSEAGQNRKTISGQVLDTEGEPVLGAAVMIEGTSDGVLVDESGKFTLKATEGQTLQISVIGYETRAVRITS